MKNKSRRPEIDAIKALAIVGVVVAHTAFGSRFQRQTSIVVGDLNIWFGWCVIAFFFCSGLLSPLSASLSSFRENLVKRAKRLLLPCFIFTVFYKLLLYGISVSGVVSWNYLLPSNGIEALQFFFIPVGPQFYFLPYLFFISILVAAVQLLLRIETIAVFFGSGLVIAYFLVEAPSKGYGPEFNLLPLYAYAYILGCILAKEESLVSVSGLALMSLPLLITSFISGNPSPCYVAVPLLLFMMFQRYSWPSAAAPCLKIGEYSSSIYVWHAPIILPMMSIFSVRLFGGGVLVLVPIIGGAILLSMVCGLVTGRHGFLRLFRF